MATRSCWKSLPGDTGFKVESLGRDDVLRFKTGDWVEITSDRREFGGTAGEMRKVTVDDTNQTLTLRRRVAAGGFSRRRGGCRQIICASFAGINPASCAGPTARS